MGSFTFHTKSKRMRQVYVKTKRLRLLALTQRQALLYADAPDTLGDELGIGMHEPSEDALRQIKGSSPLTDSGSQKGVCPLDTVWLIVRSDTMTAVGDCGLRPEAGYKHTLRLHYRIHDEYKGESYAVEAVRSITSYAFEQGGIYYITAEPNDASDASRQTLAECGFVPASNSDGDTSDDTSGDASGDASFVYELKKPPSSLSSLYMCVGMSLGMSLGISFDKMTSGMLIGMCAGLLLGAILDYNDQRSRSR